MSTSLDFRSRLELQTEILALRHPIIVLKRSANRPTIRPWDRFFWIGLAGFWPQWHTALIIVKPETVLAWYRMGFQLLWNWKCRHGKPGRPGTPKDVRDLIRTTLAGSLKFQKLAGFIIATSAA